MRSLRRISTLPTSIGCEVRTPNLYRLVADGVTFTNAYNQGAWHGAVCVASRTMLNTGYQLWDAKKAEKKLKREVVDKKQTWSQLLSAAGYQTHLSGKWHVKMKTGEAFDVARQVVRHSIVKSDNQGIITLLGGRLPAA